MAARADITQTLSRGISILEVLAQSPAPLSTTDLADYLDVPRTNVNRLLNTLLAHDLISGSSKGWRIGAGIHKLADTKSQVVDETPDVLKRIANRLDMTAFLVHARNEMCVTLACAEIPREGRNPGTAARNCSLLASGSTWYSPPRLNGRPNGIGRAQRACRVQV